MRLVGEGERRPRGRRGDFKGSTIWRRSPQSSKRLRRRRRTRHHPPIQKSGILAFSLWPPPCFYYGLRTSEVRKLRLYSVSKTGGFQPWTYRALVQ